MGGWGGGEQGVFNVSSTNHAGVPTWSPNEEHLATSSFDHVLPAAFPPGKVSRLFPNAKLTFRTAMEQSCQP